MKILIFLFEIISFIIFQYLHISRTQKKLDKSEKEIYIDSTLVTYTAFNILLIFVLLLTFPNHVFLSKNKLTLFAIIICFYLIYCNYVNNSEKTFAIKQIALYIILVILSIYLSFNIRTENTSTLISSKDTELNLTCVTDVSNTYGTQNLILCMDEDDQRYFVIFYYEGSILKTKMIPEEDVKIQYYNYNQQTIVKKVENWYINRELIDPYNHMYTESKYYIYLYKYNILYIN